MTARAYILFIITLSIALVGISPPAAASTDNSKISMAVFRIQANNCAPSIGSAVEELAVADLYSTSLFILSEKTQMDRIARRNGFADFDITDNAMVAKLGQLLSVQKIVVGSISRIGEYKITLRSIDTANGTVDISVNSSAGSDRELEGAVSKAIHSLERHYLGYGAITGFCDITLSAAALFPTGIIADGGAGTCLGSTLSASFNNVFNNGIFIAPALSWYSASSSKREVKSLSLLAGEGYAGWRFSPTKTLQISPAFGAGMLCSFTNHSRDGITYNGYYSYDRDTYYNFICTVKTDLTLFIYDRWCLTLTPILSYVPDMAGNSFLPGIALGVRFLF
jgi:hypothetical protein